MIINFCKVFFIATVTVSTMPAYGAESVESSVESAYKMALQYRDGSDGFPKDSAKAEALFKTIVAENPDHAKAFHNLGLLAYNKGSYAEARDYFGKGENLGLKESSRNIWKMQINGKIPASLEERFLAICDLNGYALPVDRANFNFNCKMGKVENTGTMSLGGALYAKTFNNSGYISFPIIWIENEKEYSNTGQINTKLLIVGQKRVI